MSYVNPTKSTIFIQTRVGEPPRKLPPQSIVTAPSGKGHSFESDFASRKYQGTRFTANQGRVTINIQSRRDAISELRKIVGDGQTLLNVIVLESDTSDNPGFDDFVVGTVFRDCGLTSIAASANLADLSTVADPKQMDIISLSAGDSQEIRPLLNSGNLLVATGLPGLPNYKGILYDENVLTAQGETELTLLVGTDGGTGGAVLHYTFSKGNKVWAALATTGLPASLVVYGAVTLNNRIIIATSQGIYHATLLNLPTMVWFLANGTTTSNIVEYILSPDPGVIIATNFATPGEYLYSYDGGFSFSRVLTTITEAFTSMASVSPQLVWIGTNNAKVIRIRSQTRWDSMVVGGLSGGEDIRALAVPPGRPNELYAGTSTGRIFKSINTDARTLTWTELYYPKTNTASPTINFLKFSPDGLTLWIGFTATVANLLIDYSGGNAGIACGTPNGGYGCDEDLFVYSNVYGLSVDTERIVLTE